MEATEAQVNPTADAWRQRIAAQLVSGRSIRAWCRENGLHEHAFYWWRSRLGLSPAPTRKRPRRAKCLGFAELVVDRAAVDESAVAGMTEPIVVRLGGARRLELVLAGSMPARQIAALIGALEAQ